MTELIEGLQKSIRLTDEIAEITRKQIEIAHRRVDICNQRIDTVNDRFAEIEKWITDLIERVGKLERRNEG